MSSLAEIRQSMGSLMSEEDIEHLQRLGNIFFANIDVDKFKPVPSEEFKEDFTMDKDVFDYLKVKAAVQSGLNPNELSDHEKELLEKYSQKREV